MSLCVMLELKFLNLRAAASSAEFNAQRCLQYFISFTGSVTHRAAALLYYMAPTIRWPALRRGTASFQAEIQLDSIDSTGRPARTSVGSGERRGRVYYPTSPPPSRPTFSHRWPAVPEWGRRCRDNGGRRQQGRPANWRRADGRGDELWCQDARKWPDGYGLPLLSSTRVAAARVLSATAKMYGDF